MENTIDSTPTQAENNTTPLTSKPQKNIILIVGIAILFLIVSLAGGYFLFAPKSKIADKPTTSVAPTTTQISPTTNPMANWKTINYSIFSIKYPTLLHVSSKDTCTYISDIEEPLDIPSKTSPGNHTVISICTYNQTMPTSFPYTNGSAANHTIRQYSANDLSGIQGQTTSTLGTENVVFIKNPQGGYVDIRRMLGDQNLFQEILSTFKFTDLSNETANWKIYSKPNISLKYPNNWFVKEISPSTPKIGYAINFVHEEHPYIIPDTTIFFSATPYKEDALGNMISNDTSIYVQVFNSKKANTVGEFADKYVDELVKLEENPETSPRKTVSKIINGNKVVIVDSYTAAEQGESHEVYGFLMKDNTSIAFYSNWAADPNSNVVNILSSMLSTFQFTN